MSSPLDRIIQGMQETEIIKRPPPSPIDDEKIQRFFDVSKQQILLPPYSITRSRVKNEEAPKPPTEPT